MSFRDAVTVAATLVATAMVLATNVVDSAPCGTFTVAGTVADVVELTSPTVMPPEPAGPVNLTVPVSEIPPTTDLAAKVIEARLGAVTVSLLVRTLVPMPA